MIDETSGKEMEKVYSLERVVECNDCGFCEQFDYCQKDSRCEVTFHERFTSDGQHFLYLEYHFDSIWSGEINFRGLEEMVCESKLWINELNIIRKSISDNWEVKLTDDIRFRCHHEVTIPEMEYWCMNSKDTIDLGFIWECDTEYCDNCGYCNHNDYCKYD